MPECESPLGVADKQGAVAEAGKGEDMQQKRETIFVKKNKNRS